MRPGRTGWATDGRRVRNNPAKRRRQSRSPSADVNFSKRRLIALPFRETDRRLRWQNRTGGRRNDRKRQHPETSTLLSAESIRKLFFCCPASTRRAERLASSIFCSFASHALQAYTVGANAFPARFCDADVARKHAIATEQSTSDAYESGVYGVPRAEIMRRKNAMNMATPAAENYCWILRRDEE